MIKKVIQQGREKLARSRRASPLFDARSVLPVREHDKIATCLRVAAFSLRSYFGEGGSAKAGNATRLSHPEKWPLCFQHSHLRNGLRRLFQPVSRFGVDFGF